MDYHAHIYWSNSHERELAMSLREWLTDQGCDMGRVWEEPIGPHPLPMYQAVYNSDNRELIENYLRNNHRNNTILLHESINDDLRDHTEGATWLGAPLELNLGVFNQ